MKLVEGASHLFDDIAELESLWRLYKDVPGLERDIMDLKKFVDHGLNELHI